MVILSLVLKPNTDPPIDAAFLETVTVSYKLVVFFYNYYCCHYFVVLAIFLTSYPFFSYTTNPVFLSITIAAL